MGDRTGAPVRFEPSHPGTNDIPSLRFDITLAPGAARSFSNCFILAGVGGDSSFARPMLQQRANAAMIAAIKTWRLISQSTICARYIKSSKLHVEGKEDLGRVCVTGRVPRISKASVRLLPALLGCHKKVLVAAANALRRATPQPNRDSPELSFAKRRISSPRAEPS